MSGLRSINLLISQPVNASFDDAFEPLVLDALVEYVGFCKLREDAWHNGTRQAIEQVIDERRRRYDFVATNGVRIVVAVDGKPL